MNELSSIIDVDSSLQIISKEVLYYQSSLSSDKSEHGLREIQPYSLVTFLRQVSWLPASHDTNIEEDSEKEKQSKLIGFKLPKISWNVHQMLLFLETRS